MSDKSLPQNVPVSIGHPFSKEREKKLESLPQNVPVSIWHPFSKEREKNFSMSKEPYQNIIGLKLIFKNKSIWAASWQNQQNGMCAQWRLRSAWSFAQSDEVFAVRMTKPWILSYPQDHTEKSLIRLGNCPGWSESSLGAHAMLILSCWGSFSCFLMFQIRTVSSEFGTYRLCEQRRFRQWVKRNLQTESQIPGPSEWPLKCVMMECSKTQIRLTRLIQWRWLQFYCNTPLLTHLKGVCKTRYIFLLIQN